MKRKIIMSYQKEIYKLIVIVKHLYNFLIRI